MTGIGNLDATKGSANGGGSRGGAYDIGTLPTSGNFFLGSLSTDARMAVSGDGIGACQLGILMHGVSGDFEG